jgi:hypothetical protein
VPLPAWALVMLAGLLLLAMRAVRTSS